MSLDFTAIDLETANAHRGSPCAVGLAKVRDGKIERIERWLVRPPKEYDYFDAYNTWLHGISCSDVRDRPSWADVVPGLIDFVGGDLVVAHNAAFDLSVIRQACRADSLPQPSMNFLCTLVMSRRVFRLPSYRLAFVSDACGVALGTRHEAGDDAVAAARIALSLAQQHSADNLPELAEHLGIRLGHMTANRFQSTGWRRPGIGLHPPSASPEADPDNPLYGRVVVFTGALNTMTRQEAWNEVARVGGLPERNPTRRTNVLVVGDINPAVLAPGCVLTGKAKRAFALQDEGCDIELMTEEDFIRTL